MSVAIMVHKEANGVNGGRVNRSAATADEWNTRKLTDMLVNESGTVVSFDGTNFKFTLAAGRYRIGVSAMWNPSGLTPVTNGFTIGLFNETTALFQVSDGSGEPILGTAGYTQYASGTKEIDGNLTVRLDGVFTVTGTNKTFSIKNKGATAAFVALSTGCGVNDLCTTNSNVNGAKASQYYMIVKLGKEV